MNLLSTTEFKVGLLVIAVSILIVYMTIGVNEDPSYFGKSKVYWFSVDDASGLIKSSSIKTAGINVGVIKEIKLYNGKARIDIAIDPEVKITEAAKVEIRAQGILGDRYVEVVLKDTSLQELPPGSEIKMVENKGSFDAVMNQVSDLATNLNDIAGTLKDSMTGEGDNSSPVGRIIQNLEDLTADISEITGEKKDKIKNSLDNLERITDNFKEVSEKLNSNQGTLGKLINDDQTIEEINTAVKGVNEFVGTAQKTQTSIDFHTDYLADMGEAKTFIGIKIQPGLDRFYELQVIDDPRGTKERTLTDSTQTGFEDKTITYKNKVKFSALFAKNFYDFTIKAGLIENSGGIGFEYNFIPNKFKFMFDAFEFSEDQPYLRAALRWSLIHGIYIVGGADDFVDEDEVSGYIGAGLNLTNDDLKLLLSKVSF